MLDLCTCMQRAIVQTLERNVGSIGTIALEGNTIIRALDSDCP
jgi:hypothetical protein